MNSSFNSGWRINAIASGGLINLCSPRRNAFVGLLLTVAIALQAFVINLAGAESGNKFSQVRAETLEQSAEALLSIRDQVYEIAYLSGGAFDLASDFETMLGNYRVLKVLRQLEKLPNDERVAACRLLFDKFLDERWRICERAMKWSENQSVPADFNGMLSLYALYVPTYSIARLGRLDILKDQLRRIEDFRERYNKALSDRFPEGTAQSRQVFLDHVFVDDRSVLNLLLVAAHYSPEILPLALKEVSNICEESGVIQNVIPYVRTIQSSRRNLLASEAEEDREVIRFPNGWVVYDFPIPAEMNSKLRKARKATIERLGSLILPDNRTLNKSKEAEGK